MDELEAFADWAAGFDVADAPDDVVRRAGLQVASAIAAAHTGTTEGWLTDGPGTADETATVVGGERADTYTAAFTNAAASIVHDYDDYLFMGHTGHSAVFASLAVCERAGLDGAGLLENVIVANELEGRLGAAVAVGPHNGQMWAFIHAAGAAAVAANVEGDATAVENAVGMALYSPDFPFDAGFIDGDSKAFTAAKPLAAGLRIGDAAVSGATASPRALADFLDSYAYLPMPEMVDGFGNSWVTRTTCYKPRPGCAYVQSPLEALERLDERGVDPETIDRMTVRAPLLSFGMEGLSRPYRGERLLPVNVTFSVCYTLALYQVAGEVSPARLGRSYLRDNRAALDAAAERVDLEHDWALTASVLEGLGQGVDYGPLLSERGPVETVRGLKRLGDAHDSVDTTGEAIGLVRSGEVGSVLRALRSPLGWDRFDIGEARFDELEFAFGTVLEVEAGGQRYQVSASEHAGSCGRPLEEVSETVREKFEREAGGDPGPALEATTRDLEEITTLL